MIDSQDNTLFHVLAGEVGRCAAQPDAAAETVALLLEQGSGWDVVDMKNKKGERAELVATTADPDGPARHLLDARSRSFREELRFEKPLTLIPEDSPVPWKWQTMLLDEQRRSYSSALLGAFDKDRCKEWFNVIVAQTPWQILPGVPRKVVWYVDEDFKDCPYRYSGLEFKARPFPPWMQEIRKEVGELCGIPADELPNSCNMNVYEDHRGEVGWHSDDEVYFQGLAGDTRIISLSLGSARPFCWRMQGTTQTVGSCRLGDGDIMTMEGLFQKHYKHSVPVSEAPCGKRINMTFRWIKVRAHATDAATKAVTA